MAFPTDDYTPYGYLDVPGHTRNLSPRGVLRSYGAGLRWHFPAFAGMYGGRRETYRAGMRLALDGALDLADFDAATSPYHSKDLLAFELRRGAAGCSASLQLLDSHVLHMAIEPRGAARLALLAEYERLLAAAGEWGESGLVGRLEDGLLVLQAFEDGDAFVIWASRPFADVGVAAQASAARAWAALPAPGLPAEGFVTTIGRPQVGRLEHHRLLEVREALAAELLRRVDAEQPRLLGRPVEIGAHVLGDAVVAPARVLLERDD
ncbi:MAG TPA: hypothetical protein PLO33_04195, partial [Kouleothrix sp.]|nr:hypothetical protein [Kouleothrix sp.]